MATGLTPDLPAAVAEGTIRAAQDRLRKLEYRDWSLWVTAIVVMLLLAMGMYSFSIAPLGRTPGEWFQLDLEIAIRALFGIVLLFALVAFHKQVVVNRLRRELAGQVSLAAALQTRAELFHKLAILDPLTGLYNRRFAMQHLAIELSRSERHHYKVTALMFDLNGLKQINDRHSHLAGDLALREFATAMRRAIRSSDVAMRLGGDEFLVILPECEAIAVPRVLARMTDLNVHFRGQQIPMSFSAGWAEHLVGEAPEELLARADERLYEDKRTGTAGNQARTAKEDLRQTEKMALMGRITSGVAHDFNNLLTIIKGYSQLVLENLDPSHSMRPHVEQIEQAAERAASLTGQLLAFGRKQVLQPRQLELTALVLAMRMMLARLAGSGVELSLELQPDLHEIRADTSQVEQVIMNLVANARDAMPNGGQLVIGAENCEMEEAFVASHPGSRLGTYVRIFVRDTGTGMDANTKSRIFEPFFTTKEAGKGTGLGLASVYDIVKQNAGYITVDSEVGKGTCVSVYLPQHLRNASRTVAEMQPASVSADQVSGETTVLVVENFDGLRKFMADYLLAIGYRVVEAMNGEQAIHIVSEQRGAINAMVCDVILPGMSGLELSECLTTENNDLPVLYIAGYAEDALVYREWLKGRVNFLSAPFSPEEFAKALKELLETPKDGATSVN